METAMNDAAPPQVRPFGKLRASGGKPPDAMTTTLYLPKPLHYRVEAQAALLQMHRQELLGRLVEAVFPESKAPSRSFSDLIHLDLVEIT